MPVKIRLQRRGRKKAPFYHIVVADARSPRDGRFIEKLGMYNPMTKPAIIELDRDSAYDWLMKGAQPTDTAIAILRFKGVLYRKHLMNGVRNGDLTEEKAIEKYQLWIEEKEAKLASKREDTTKEFRSWHEKINNKTSSEKVTSIRTELLEEDTPAKSSNIIRGVNFSNTTDEFKEQEKHEDSFEAMDDESSMYISSISDDELIFGVVSISEESETKFSASSDKKSPKIVESPENMKVFYSDQDMSKYADYISDLIIKDADSMLRKMESIKTLHEETAEWIQSFRKNQQI